MKKILYIFITTLLFAGNLEVEGGINATGNVQSPNIQALIDQITQLQNQILELQSQLSSNSIKHKILTINYQILGDDGTITLLELMPNISIDWGMMTIVNCSSERCEAYTERTSNNEMFFYNNQSDFGLTEFVSHVSIENENTEITLVFEDEDEDDFMEILLTYKEL
tara:strand:+ start:535 stop:1035 length:501 start_codon:yes stop_codon:yes gene_type:complete